MSKARLKNITLTIDGKSVKVAQESTILHAARKAGIYIPTLCFLDGLKNYGGCRLCMVEVKNTHNFQTACTTPVFQGMEVTTKSSGLQNLRREILELILSEHPFTCLVCKDKGECQEFMHTTRKVSVTTGCNFCTSNGDCELQDLVDYLELKEVKFPWIYRNIAPVKDNPFYELDYNLCILCGRCVRVCNEERYSEVLAFVQRGNKTLVGTAFNESQLEAGCEYCGACVDVCPTGSISEKMGSWVGIPDRSTKTTCTFCAVACTMNVNTKGNRIVNIGPKKGERTEPLQLCVRGKFIPGDIVHHPERITMPLIKKADKWIEASWGEAITFIAQNLDKYRGNHFGLIGSAQDSLENSYILQKFTRKTMQSNNVDLLNAFGEKGLVQKIHDHYSVCPPPMIDDITSANTLFVIGSDCSLTHPIIENRIRKAFKQGKQVLAANTLFNRTAYFSNHFIVYQPGEEYHFLLLLLSELLKGKNSKTSKQISKYLKNFDISNLLDQCGVASKDIEKLSNTLQNSENIIIIAGDGVLKTSGSLHNLNALIDIQLLINEQKDCRMMYLFDEGNRYGSSLMGMHPDHFGGFDKVSDPSSVKKWSENWNCKLSSNKGSSGDEMVRNISGDGIKALFVMGDIPPHKNLSGLKFFVQQNMFLTGTSKYADVFLPMSSFMEAEGRIINLEQKLKNIVPAIKPAKGNKPSWKVISEIAHLMSEPGFNYRKAKDILSEIRLFIDFTEVASSDRSTGVQPLGTKAREKTEGYPVSLTIAPDQLHYMGNILTDLVPDLKAISMTPEALQKTETENNG